MMKKVVVHQGCKYKLQIRQEGVVSVVCHTKEILQIWPKYNRYFQNPWAVLSKYRDKPPESFLRWFLDLAADLVRLGFIDTAPVGHFLQNRCIHVVLDTEYVLTRFPSK